MCKVTTLDEVAKRATVIVPRLGARRVGSFRFEGSKSNCILFASENTEGVSLFVDVYYEDLLRSSVAITLGNALGMRFGSVKFTSYSEESRGIKGAISKVKALVGKGKTGA